MEDIQYAIRAKSTAVNYFRIDSSICGLCQDFFVFSLLHVNKTYDKSETETLHEAYLVRHLIVQPNDFNNLIEMRKIMHQAVTPANLPS